jgi:carboxyl-terminal processing protease
VSRGSASAAEIVSGALQDHDRALIFGENTFGKGLVQAPYQLSGDCSLLLTIARFYTPSGRLIQRDYSKGSFFDYYYRTNTATQNKGDQKMTDSGRVVFGGGGIAPDEKFEAAKLNKLQAQLLGRATFFYFSAKYFGPKEATLPANFEVDDQLLEEFRQFLVDRKTPFEESEFAANRDWIKRTLKLELLITAFGKERSDEVAVVTEPAVIQAAQNLPKARALLDKAKRMVAERRNAK